MRKIRSRDAYDAGHAMWRALSAVALAFVTMPAAAQVNTSPATDGAAQDVVIARTGELAFGGATLRLSGFTGLMGYASEVAYVVVIDGTVTTGGLRAGRGRMLLLPAMGAAPIKQRFDAARLAGGDVIGRLPPMAQAQLRELIGRQNRGVFLGRLARTRLNVAAPGDADGELARRSVVDTPAVRAIRFSGERDLVGIERRVVLAFVHALRSRDAEAVGALMDPVPFGNSDLRGDATAARRLMAQALIDSQDWPTLLDGVVPVTLANGAGWALAGAHGQGMMTTRRIGDFVFVRAIEMGAK